MANRTDSAAVCAVLETTLDDDEVEPFIDTANILVTEYLATPLSGKTALLKEIETYLAAHFVALRDRIAKSESADGVRFVYEGETGMGLDGSRYGQTAQMLDSSGTLSSLSDEDRIVFIGKVGSEATNASAKASLSVASSPRRIRK